jgi:hypothetical protein
MKKIWIPCLFLFLLGSAFKIALVSKSGPSEELRDDPVFQELIEKEVALFDDILKANNNDPKSLWEAQKKMEELSNQPAASEEENLKQANDILNLTDKPLDKFYYKFKDQWADVQKRYGSRLTEEYVKDETMEFARSSPIRFIGESGFDCRDTPGYVLCAAAATAAAMLAHAGCVATLFGAPACFALVALIQVAAIRECKRAYCDPITK